jgi:hypothetical protein
VIHSYSFNDFENDKLKISDNKNNQNHKDLVSHECSAALGCSLQKWVLFQIILIGKTDK